MENAPVMKKVHLSVGVLGICAFLGTGQYMDIFHNHLDGMADAPRLLYRSSHIYLFLCSMINLAVGVYLPQDNNEFRWYKYVFSAAILASPFIMFAGFFIEPELIELNRPYTRAVIKILFATSILTLLGMFMRSRKALIKK